MIWIMDESGEDCLYPSSFFLTIRLSKEALENIRIAIQEYLGARQQLLQNEDARTVSVTVWAMPKIPGVNHLQAIRALRKAGLRKLL